LKFEGVKEDSIKKHLAEAAGAGLIVLYTVDGKAYLEIQDFGQRVQAKSKYPGPEDGSPDSSVIHGGSRRKTAVVGDGVEGEGGSTRTRTKRNPKTPLPDGFALSERVQTWAKERGFTRLSEHLDAFKAKCLANGYTYADWDSAFMEAVRNDWAKLGSSRNSTVNHGEPVKRPPPKREFPG
jgi:hypothetical protein